MATLLTEDQIAELMATMRRNWRTVQQDASMYEEGNTMEAVMRRLIGELSKTLAKYGNVVSGAPVLYAEPASTAEVKFRGETTQYHVSGMTRIGGEFRTKTQIITVRPVWVSHPFWQCRPTSRMK